jgi:hypothetical protein
MKSIFRNALVNSLATTAYIGVVGEFLFYAAQLRLGHTKSALVPTAMLLLLVFSSALVGALIFGRPVLWYLEGRRREGLLLLAETLVILFVVTFAVFSTLIVLM